MILVTGDAGFIGTCLVSRMQEHGASLVGIDLVPRHSSSSEYPQIIGNILDPEPLMRAMKGVDIVIHLAAEHTDQGVTREQYVRVNETGTKHILECASRLGIRKFVFFSSVAVYGDVQNPGEDESAKPVSDYGVSKLAGEHAVQQWFLEDPARSSVIIRPTVVFGPRSRSNMFRLITYVCDRKFVQIGKGENIKSVAYVENLVQATEFLMKDMRPGVEIFNYADEPQMTTRELVRLIARTAEVPEPRIVIPYRPAYLAAKGLDLVGSITSRSFSVTSVRLKKFNTSTRYQSEKIRSRGFNARFSIADGLANTIEWYRNEGQRRESSYDQERVEG